MQRVELGPKERKELAAAQAMFTAKPLPPQGRCAGCGRGIPQGYLPVVTRWGSVHRGGMAIQVAVEMLCKDCGEQQKTGGRVIRKTRVAEPETAHPAVEAPKVAPTVREIALALYNATSDHTAHTSRWLADDAGLEYGDHILVILRKLRDAGKLRFVDGKWIRW
jgi:hypothetical protein